jgi:hypothetical protein
MPSSRRTSHTLTQNYPRSTVSHCHAYGTSGTTKTTNNNRGTTTMETVMSRIGRLLGMRMHNPTRPVCPVPQSTEAVPSSPDTFEVVAVSKKKKRSRKHNILLKPNYMKLSDSIDTVKNYGARVSPTGSSVNTSSCPSSASIRSSKPVASVIWSDLSGPSDSAFVTPS